MDNDENVFNKIVFGDEVTFQINVNKNCYKVKIQGAENTCDVKNM